jgi:16S rRNA processing protein RimM
MQNESVPDVRGCASTPQGGGEQIPAVRRPIPEVLTIATVLAPWGLRGELKVRIETDFPDRFSRLSHVLLGAEREPFEVEAFRQQQGHGLLKLKGCDDRNAAERLRDSEVQIPLSEAMPLPAGQYYSYQVEGLAVCTEEGEPLGTIEEVLFTGGNAVYVTQGPRGEVLIPVLRDVVLKTDLEGGQVVVRLPAGLLD